MRLAFKGEREEIIMSCSSLWVMDSKYVGSEVCEFGNSWFFSPIIWDVLLEKYLPARRMKLFNGEVAGYMSSVTSDRNLFSDLNEVINNCDCFPDRVCWEMSQQQVFFTKDKNCVSECICKFLEINTGYQDCILAKEHITERFQEIANSIKELNEKEDIHFVFKNTSCDDNVEYWFSKYNETDGEYENRSLSELDKGVTEFVTIENDKIKSFLGNLDYFNERR